MLDMIGGQSQMPTEASKSSQTQTGERLRTRPARKGATKGKGSGPKEEIVVEETPRVPHKSRLEVKLLSPVTIYYVVRKAGILHSAHCHCG